jgi:hypothetical protein
MTITLTIIIVVAALAGVALASPQVRARLADDRGIDDSPSKLIWIAGSLAIAVAAVAFAISVFNDTKDDVENPVVPDVDGGGFGG